MSLSEHLGELRKRVLKVTLILLIGTVLAATYSKEIFDALQRPLLNTLPNPSGFIALSPLEGWVVYLKVAFVTAIFATTPLWFYQMWAFINPALVKDERRVLVVAALASSVCFVAGGLFGYFVILPTGFHYLVAIYEKTNTTLYPQMQWYLSFVLRALFAFGLVFETPLVLVLLARFGVVSSKAMRRARKYVIVCRFIFAAVVTPGPDVFSQIAVAIPLVIFYELGVLAARLMEKKR
jgi:sec-independent protein translocase protein TatC